MDWFFNLDDDFDPHLFRLLKLLRIPRLFELLDVERFKGILNLYYAIQLNNAVTTDNFSYHYPILRLLKMIYIYRVLQIIIIIISCSYFLAIFWNIFVNDMIDHENWSTPDVFNGEESFFTNYELIDEGGSA